MNNINDKSADSVHIEDSASENIVKNVNPKQRMGDVKLLQGNGETVLVPTPSPDPNGKSQSTPSLLSSNLCSHCTATQRHQREL